MACANGTASIVRAFLHEKENVINKLLLGSALGLLFTATVASAQAPTMGSDARISEASKMAVTEAAVSAHMAAAEVRSRSR